MSRIRTESPEAFAERLRHERQARAAGYRRVAGIDEVGRGPLAGPVVAACVVLPEDVGGLEGVRDSKQLSPASRERLAALVRERALAVGLGLADAAEVDRLNVLQATFLAMQRAFEALDPRPDYCLIDGNRRPRWASAGEAIVRGDARSLSIGAASIVAKVARDRMMEEFDLRFPAWGFARHKGYGTAEHLQAIRRHGVCEIHRRSFFPISQLALLPEP